MKSYHSVVFSGLPGAGKSTLVKKLSEIYGWPVHSIGDLWRQKWEKLYPNKKVSFEDYWRSTTHEDRVKINVDAREIFSQGRIIGDSRYTIYLRDLPVCLVFVSAPLEIRATRAFGLEKYKGKSIEEIRLILAGRESDEVVAGSKLFGYDYRDSSYYDLVINSGTLTLDDEIALIKSIVRIDAKESALKQKLAAFPAPNNNLEKD